MLRSSPATFFEAAGEYPEKFVNGVKSGSGVPALQHRELLSESQIFQNQVLTRAKNTNECSEPESEEAGHEPEL
jgi:hypothetical protein